MNHTYAYSSISPFFLSGVPWSTNWYAKRGLAFWNAAYCSCLIILAITILGCRIRVVLLLCWKDGIWKTKAETQKVGSRKHGLKPFDVTTMTKLIRVRNTLYIACSLPIFLKARQKLAQPATPAVRTKRILLQCYLCRAAEFSCRKMVLRTKEEWTWRQPWSVWDIFLVILNAPAHRENSTFSLSQPWSGGGKAKSFSC